jgi:hypothetical protein
MYCPKRKSFRFISARCGSRRAFAFFEHDHLIGLDLRKKIAVAFVVKKNVGRRIVQLP